MKYVILIQEYLGYTSSKRGNPRPKFGRTRSMAINSDLNVEELRTKIAELLGVKR